ncbi:LysR family transcriptional regulator [Desulfuromonas acetoxidans]|uniref:Transcriptional regulator, LysR family n=1 Tax=Desulfuromonas acetoxidans (strain DSM 684 / 11070) TaxID=281689 RepID=Q1JXU6_DESA6|nr:LysR family transcriptional regulator [Desulfuromonas acetoxidans]EAT15047.1 transcriptional regulator, LysR family [Desulfuromonas acetoxidans DSM 684]MBF0646355.1 LysR family transcriptional regulator [Desulfuromonas acetoxidans]NVD24973.1 LysR family transcriptional regulator [Desulfuromonas acetoxidans]NVE15274.1 LysR family transcriptional regulator [Desulfuromonas acetoxidans]
MEILNLRTLVEVAAVGSISGAADKLCVTQSAVSRRIKTLEDQCGHGLLDRSGVRLTLTEWGHVVLEQAKKMIALQDELQASLKQVEEKESFAFGCTPAFGIAHLPKLLERFMLTHGQVSGLKFIFDMPDKIAAGLSDGCFDLAIIEHCQCLDLSGFKTTELRGDDMIFVRSPKLGEMPEQVDIEQLFPIPLYGRQEGCCSRIFLEKNLEFVGRKFADFRKFILYDDLHLIVDAVVNGSGIAFISSDVVAEPLKRGDLQAHTVNGFVHSRKRTLVENLSPSPALANLFRQTLFDYFSEL